MKQMRKISALSIITLSLLTGFLLYISHTGLRTALSSGSSQYQLIEDVAVTVNTVNEAKALPCTLSGYASGSPVTISFDLPAVPGSCLYLNPVYTDAEIYADGTLIYSYGKQGTYPSVFIDPPAAAFSVGIPFTPDSTDKIHIEIREHIPTARHSLILHTLAFGSETAIISYLVQRYGPSLVLSLLFIVLGVVLLIMSLFLISLEKSGILLFPALLALFAGIWECSESAMTLYFTGRASTLYVTSFLGLFVVVLPLIRFTQIFVIDRPLLQWLYTFLLGSVIIAAILQLTAICPFSVSLFYFHAVILCILITLVVFTVFYALVKKNRHARLFSYAIFILALSAVLEVLNFYFHFTDRASVFFQIGVLLFILMIGVLGCLSIRSSMLLKVQNLSLSHEVEMLALSAAEQKRRSDILSSHEAELRKQRHDLRHHIHVIREELDAGNYTMLNDYLDTIEEAIPVDHSKNYCKNETVNALIRYYASAIEQDHIALAIHADIPVSSSQVTDAHLCALIGNLLENAWEACTRMTGTELSRFIRFDSTIQGNVLYISVDNSFNGKLTASGSLYISDKSGEVGTGLRSVCSIARKHGGDAAFRSMRTPEGDTFRSEVYIKI